MMAKSIKQKWALTILKSCVKTRYIDYNKAGFELQRITGMQWDEIVREAIEEDESRK